MKATAAIVLCWPAGLVSPELLFWLQDIGIPRKNILFNPGNRWSWAVAMNDSVRRALSLPDRIQRFIFADADIRPEGATVFATRGVPAPLAHWPALAAAVFEQVRP